MARRAKKVPIHPVVAAVSLVWEINKPAMEKALAEAAFYGSSKVEVPSGPAWLLELFGLAGDGPLGSGSLLHSEVLVGPKDWIAAREAFCSAHDGWATAYSPLLRCTRVS